MDDNWIAMTVHKTFKTIEERDHFISFFDLTSDAIAVSFKDMDGYTMELQSTIMGTQFLFQGLKAWRDQHD
jgi:hypothetical protein